MLKVTHCCSGELPRPITVCAKVTKQGMVWCLALVQATLRTRFRARRFGICKRRALCGSSHCCFHACQRVEPYSPAGHAITSTTCIILKTSSSVKGPSLATLTVNPTALGQAAPRPMHFDESLCSSRASSTAENGGGHLLSGQSPTFFSVGSTADQLVLYVELDFERVLVQGSRRTLRARANWRRRASLHQKS